MNVFRFKHLSLWLLLCLWTVAVYAQQIQWSRSGSAYYVAEQGNIFKVTLPNDEAEPVISSAQLQDKASGKSIRPEKFSFTPDESQFLIFTASERVWRYKTRGDYWLYNRKDESLKQLGKGLPASSLMFAKFSANGRKVAYVSRHNIYVEDLASGKISQLTNNSDNPRVINGTFDWAYEEEFSLRDGFRWSPGSEHIAYWQIDASPIRDFYMINNTDSVYSRIIPVEYPKAGFPPSSARIGVLDVNTGKNVWMSPPGKPDEYYIARMEWTPDGSQIILQQLNRKQNESRLWLCNPATGAASLLYTETDDAWVSHINEWSDKSDMDGWDWLANGKEFIWTSERGGWRQLYKLSLDGKVNQLITPGNYDVISLLSIDEKNGFVYFMASPDEATEKYLYRAPLSPKKNSQAERITPARQKGTHQYVFSPDAKIARHVFSNYYTPYMAEWVYMPSHKALNQEESIEAQWKNTQPPSNSNISFFKVRTEDGVELDGWMQKPKNFDESKKYPVVFYVYGEPAATTVNNEYGGVNNFLYNGDMAEDGYIHISLDNRGMPAPKGRSWRKAIYKNIGQVNIRDQAMAARKLLEAPYMDKDRVAVWGWSGGGSSTLNLLFQYPEIFKTGISIAPVTASYLYDNIYTERYMGLPQENMADYEAGAALTHAHKLQGNLLLIHGTGDDNVHFQNAEMLVNELIRHQKLFSYMPYPNRSHSISEGAGTSMHLRLLVSDYLKKHCPPGGVSR